MEQDLSGFRPSRLWKQMSMEKRLDAAELFWSDEHSTEQQVEAIGSLAGHMKFRTKSVVALPVDRKAKYLVALPNVSDSVAARALVNYHLARQRPMMIAFLDALGITHEEGLIAEENVTAPDIVKMREAATELASTFPADDVSLYFSTLVSQDPDTWSTLVDLPQTAGDESPTVA